ncbi:hypothetical protein M8J76_002489 [Diaphorina citri]|nr:hypothetical protein M8J76_002489 [Diaphorina citri]KAI5739500.1 hypothetical protein M8J77_020027 [Diaphorina citri]
MTTSTTAVCALVVVCLAAFVRCDPPAETTAAPSNTTGAPANTTAGPQGANKPLPPITDGASVNDVLGDAEKGKVCAIDGKGVCPAAGPADAICLSIATAVGNTSESSCVAQGICKFKVNCPVQHPQTPGFAYVTEGQKPNYGVIYPCNKGCLVISSSATGIN